VTGHGRKLSSEEAALWARVAKTVVPLEPRRHGEGDRPTAGPGVEGQAQARAVPKPTARPPAPLHQPAAVPTPRPGEFFHTHGLDSGWERNLARGLTHPDFTLDLHGCTLDQAHSRLLHGLTQAKAMGARLVLLITGKPRFAEPGERGQKRGAIRAKVIDWLSVSEHALDIAAIRGAHRRHGGQGALYVVLKRRR